MGQCATAQKLLSFSDKNSHLWQIKRPSSGGALQTKFTSSSGGTLEIGSGNSCAGRSELAAWEAGTAIAQVLPLLRVNQEFQSRGDANLTFFTASVMKK